VAYPQVIFGDSQWMAVLPVGIMGILLFCVGFMCTFTYIVIVPPLLFQHRGFPQKMALPVLEVSSSGLVVDTYCALEGSFGEPRNSFLFSWRSSSVVVGLDVLDLWQCVLHVLAMAFLQREYRGPGAAHDTGFHCCSQHTFC